MSRMPACSPHPANLTILVLANFSAGLSPEDRSADLVASFSRYPHVTCRVENIRESEGISPAIDRAIASGVDIVAAGGGDGTVSSVAHLLAGKNVALGVLPLGTLNHFAKDLGIPLDLDGAVDALCAGETIEVDAGEVNGRHFVNNVSIGAYPKVVQLRDSWRRFLGKWPAMVLATLAVLFRMPWFRVHMEWNGKRVRRFIPLLFVGNNPYHVGWPELGSRPKLTGGILWMMLLKEMPFFGMLRGALLALIGRLWDIDELEVFEAREVSVRSSRPHVTVAIDGETFRMHTPLVFRSHPAALKVRVPIKDTVIADSE